MSKPYQLTGLPKGAIDKTRNEVRFELTAAEGEPLTFVAKYAVAAQVIAGLGRMVSELRKFIDAAKAGHAIAAEPVASACVQKDRWPNQVLLQLTTPQGVPYTFVIPTLTATAIAERLKSESEIPTQVGRA
jgi:hypothetical protein